jgi:tRNA G18 (ribose-2'-O)-methylase SpoU
MVTEERNKKIEEYYSWTHPFGIAVHNISKEFNIGSLLRTAHCAKVKDFFLIGNQDYNAYAAVSSEKWTKINHFKTLDEFFAFVKTTSYNLILVEQSSNSKSLFEFKFPDNPLFLFGKERGGLPKEVMNQDYPVLEIPQFGMAKSLNLSCSGSIVVYHYLNKLYEDGKLGK